jgi:hypothetical protein
MTAIRYNTETCSRCGGGGQYSYCQMHGSVCFKCRGTGKQYTKNAQRAMKRIGEFKERYHVRLDELKAGDICKFDGKWVTVVSVPGLNGLVAKSRVNNGPWIERQQFEVQFKNFGFISTADATIERRYTPEQFTNELLPFARKFSGVTVEE